jgi:hypothetical protein
MKKFGFGKKSSEERKGSPDPSSNPYAQQPQITDPYAAAARSEAYGIQPTAYQQAKANSAPPGGQYGLPNGPRAGHGGNGGGAYDQGGYGGGGYGGGPPSVASTNTPPPAYGAERYGSGTGYGANRYDTNGGYAPATNSRGPGGYGGLGRVNSNETTTTEDNRDALFGGAKERYAKKTTLPPANGQPGGGYEANSGTSSQPSYGAYGTEGQLTAEEEEEEDITATKQQIRFMKQEDVSSTRNALRIAAQAEETGRSTLARLGAQGERIHNTEKNLDLAANHNRIAEEKARELKTLNKSMFAVHVSNPFTASSRRAARDQDIMDKHRAEREQREATREAAFGTQQRMEGAFRQLQPGDQGYQAPRRRPDLAERAKYQFEADSEDDELENEIDTNLDALSGAAGRLNLLARATGEEVDAQNRHIDRINQKTDKVDDQIAMNRARLDRIH